MTKRAWPLGLPMLGDDPALWIDDEAGVVNTTILTTCVPFSPPTAGSEVTRTVTAVQTASNSGSEPPTSQIWDAREVSPCKWLVSLTVLDSQSAGKESTSFDRVPFL